MALIDRIKYDAPYSPDQTPYPWLVYKYPSENLVLGTQLVVNESQEVLFLKGGELLAQFTSGTHTLSTNNIPLLDKLVNLPFGGKTPFSAEVYFLNKVARLDLKWGTTDPITVTDPRYGILANIRSFGQFGVKIENAKLFFTQLIGALSHGQITDFAMVSSFFRSIIISHVKETIARMVLQERLSILDLPLSFTAIGSAAKDAIYEECSKFGITLVNFVVESVNVPTEDLESIKRTLNERAEFSILGDERYNRKRSFDILQSASQNNGTQGAVIGMGLGLGTGTALNPLINSLTTSTNGIVCSASDTGRICPSCNSSVANHARFCPTCGTAQGNGQCHCGFENNLQAKFCGGCGTKLQGE